MLKSCDKKKKQLIVKWAQRWRQRRTEKEQEEICSNMIVAVVSQLYTLSRIFEMNALHQI